VQRVGGTGKEQVRLEELTSHLKTRLVAYSSFLLERAGEFARSRTHDADDWEGFVEAVANGFARSFHCGRPACEDEIKAETTATPRCVPADGNLESGLCVRCGTASAYEKRVLFGRAY